MKDLTQGPVSRQVLAMAAPIAIGMLFQTLYYLIDLYFVGRLGDHAIAGVSTAGNVTFVVMALTQALGVGAVALVAQAVGRRDVDDANVNFNQSLSMGAFFALLTTVDGLRVDTGLHAFARQVFDPRRRGRGIRPAPTSLA